MAFGTLLLAGGTLAVALVTGFTARRTRQLAEATVTLATSTEQEVKAVVDQAKAARDEVEVSREALQATYRPRLVDLPFGLSVRESGAPMLPSDDATILVGPAPREDRPPTDASIRVAARNVGTGLALIQEVRLRWHEPGSVTAPEETIRIGLATPAVLPPAEFTRVWFTFGPEESYRIQSIFDLGAFAVEVRYQDVSGQVAEMTRLEISTREGQQNWRVRQVKLYVDGEETPYASTGPQVSG